MTDVRHILACGYYGFANAGDEAILAALLTDIRALYPGALVTVLSGHPSTTKAEYGVESVHWQDVAQMIFEAEKADLMVLGGGGLYQDHQGFDVPAVLTTHHGNIGYYAGFTLLAGLTETPLSIYGVGVGPLASPDAQRFTRLSFGRASSATVRDEGSLQLLESIGVESANVLVSADPAWSLDPAPEGTAASILDLEHAVTGGTATIGVAVRPWGDNEWVSDLASALDRLIDELDARVIFLPFQESPYSHENDANAALEVSRRMDRIERTSIVRGGYLPSERLALLQATDLTIGMRLHSAIFALRTGRPTVALAYDPKVTATMEQVGLGDQVVDLGNLTTDRIVTSSKRALDRGGPDPATIDIIRKQAGRNLEALRGPFPLPEVDAETTAAYTELAFTRIRAQADMEAEFDELREDHRMLEIAHDQSIRDRETLEQQKDTIIHSRAFRLVDSYWRARESIRATARKASRKAPASLRPTLERVAGPDPSAEDAPTPGGDLTLRRQIEDQLARVLDEHPDVPGIVVYPPSIGWKVSLFQRPQQMALAFARLGYLVFYGIDHINNEGVMGLHWAAPRIYLTAIPWGMTDLLEMIRDPISVSYVYNFAFTKHLKDPRVIFEHIDELEVFTAAHRLDDLEDWYDEAIIGADVVAGSARDLVSKVSDARPGAVLCPNGVDYRHFAEYAEGEPPEDIADITGGEKPIVGYYGALAEWVDYPLIRKSALELSDFEFVFIGPDYDGSINAHTEVFGLPNVRWLGVKDYSELPAYLHYFDVATIPFVVNEVTHSVSPIKLFEYMAGGRPVVTPNLRECAHYGAVQVGTDADDYVAKLRHAALELRRDPEHLALLKRTARANTWEIRVGTLIDALAHTGRL